MKLYKDVHSWGGFNITTSVGELVAELLKLDQCALVYSEGCDCTGNVVKVLVEDDGTVMLCRDDSAVETRKVDGKWQDTIAPRYKDQVQS